MKLVYNNRNNNTNNYRNNNRNNITNINNNIKIITFSTCWYVLKSKFPIPQYLKWIKNLLSIVNNFYLVIYTNRESFVFLSPLINRKNKNIKIIIKPIEEFYTYKYKDLWIKNHSKINMDLHKKIDWELNMLWNEKVFFVQETINNKYFSTIYYGWCDIGYFRNRTNDLNTYNLYNWPNNKKLLSKNFKNICIHYGCVENDILKYLKKIQDIKYHYNNNTNKPIIDYNESCFAGG